MAQGFDREIFLEQLAEIYEGVQPGNPSWIVTGGPETGVFGSVEPLSAAQASQTPCGSLSIAAHTEHLRWSHQYALACFKGESASPDWSESWSVNSIDELAWRDLLVQLRRSYEEITRAVERQENWSDYRLRAGTLAIISHGSYHLGALRALRKTVIAQD